MKQLIEYIVSNIVNHLEKVVVTQEEVGEGLAKYLIEVDPEDVGRVIGKQGKVIKAIRQIGRIAAIQKGLRIIVDLKEDGKVYTQESDEEMAAEDMPSQSEVATTTTEESAEPTSKTE